MAAGPGLAERARALEASGHSIVYVGWGETVHAVLSLDDMPLPEARAMLDALRDRGLCVMLLTGDHEAAAQRIAAAVGIATANVEAALMPEAKREALDRRRQGHGVLAMVGDGLNDGPVLAEADVGIAVGSATDLARETAAVVLPADGMWMLPWGSSTPARFAEPLLPTSCGHSGTISLPWHWLHLDSCNPSLRRQSWPARASSSC